MVRLTRSFALKKLKKIRVRQLTRTSNHIHPQSSSVSQPFPRWGRVSRVEGHVHDTSDARASTLFQKVFYDATIHSTQIALVVVGSWPTKTYCT